MPQKHPARARPTLPTAHVPGPLKAQVEQLEASVGAMSHNASKALEHGFDNATDPPVGATVKPSSRLVTGRTLSEENGSEKTGSAAVDGSNSTIETLDQMRVDSGGQALTNQGAKIADNQNASKFGPRGPVLLEDFILHEKIRRLDIRCSLGRGSPFQAGAEQGLVSVAARSMARDEQAKGAASRRSLPIITRRPRSSTRARLRWSNPTSQSLSCLSSAS